MNYSNDYSALKMSFAALLLSDRRGPKLDGDGDSAGKCDKAGEQKENLDWRRGPFYQNYPQNVILDTQHHLHERALEGVLSNQTASKQSLNLAFKEASRAIAMSKPFDAIVEGLAGRFGAENRTWLEFFPPPQGICWTDYPMLYNL